jgi:hypothetical protein
MSDTLRKEIEERFSVLLVAGPGTAKTARLNQIAKALNRKIVVMRGVRNERVDFEGYKVPDMARGVTRTMPDEFLTMLKTIEEPTTLFLDDIGQTPDDVQAAMMGLWDSGFLSPHVNIVGATNRPGDKAAAKGIIEPLRSRFDSTYVIPGPETMDKPDGGALLHSWQEELAGWCEWAMDSGAAPEFIAYHRNYGPTSDQTLYRWKPHADPSIRMPDYRTWETAMRKWNAGMRTVHYMSSTIGKPAAAHFLAYAALIDRIPSLDQIIMDPVKSPIPDDPGALYLVTTIIEAGASKKNFDSLMTYMPRLPRVYGALAARGWHRRHGDWISGNARWTRWFCENEALFSV